MTALEAFAAGQKMSAPLEDMDDVEPAAMAAANAVAAASVVQAIIAPTTSSEAIAMPAAVAYASAVAAASVGEAMVPPITISEAIAMPTASIEAHQLLHLQEGPS